MSDLQKSLNFLSIGDLSNVLCALGSCQDIRQGVAIRSDDTACASERNWGLMFAKNRARLGIEREYRMIFLSAYHVFTEFSDAELLDLSL